MMRGLRVGGVGGMARLMGMRLSCSLAGCVATGLLPAVFRRRRRALWRLWQWRKQASLSCKGLCEL
jgi:hypothetical protein